MYFDLETCSNDSAEWQIGLSLSQGSDLEQCMHATSQDGVS